MTEFNKLIKNLKLDFSGLKKIRISLLGDSSTQFLNMAIRATGYDYGYDLIIDESEIDQIHNMVFDNTSALFKSDPEIVIIFQATEELLERFNKTTPANQQTFADSELQMIKKLKDHLSAIRGCRLLFFNFPEVNDGVFGNYANKTTASFLYQLRKLNFNLMELARLDADFFLLDLCSIQNEIGRKSLFAAAAYISSHMTLTLEALPLIAQRINDIINAMNGSFVKCVIVDLDNTLWGGVLAEDGIDKIEIGNLGIGKAFSNFQYWLKKLLDRGIVISVCSKNDEAIARSVFEHHPDMIIKLEDIAVFIANWDSKAANIQIIQQKLNIGFDAMVFLDDNPYERNLIKQCFPSIKVPELPADPALYVEYLSALNLFEAIHFTEEDKQRNFQYVEIERMHQEKINFENEDDFLKSIDMVSAIVSMDSFTIPRISQLSQRSNQFNLTTIRYTEKDLAQLAENSQISVLGFNLTDKFANHGLIASVILEKINNDILYINNWFMSCRILRRGMEHFIINCIVNLAREANIKQIVGRYIPTKKNLMVSDLYKKLGFVSDDDLWKLNIRDFKMLPNFIKQK